MNTDAKTLFLSFDDGPTPEITEWILESLEKFQAKATFFCLGQNAEKFPHLLKQIRDAGHVISSHGYSHSNGWKLSTTEFIQNVKKGATILDTSVFRPPYGKFTLKQYKFLKNNYRLVLWDVLCGDYDSSRSGEQCKATIINMAKPGSIIVLHDNYKAEKNLKYILPRILHHYTSLGYEFKSLVFGSAVP